MSPLSRAAAGAVIPGLLAGAAFTAAAAVRGSKDSGSAIAANAPSHVVWGEAAALERRLTLRQTAPGILLNLGAGVFWATVMQMFLGPSTRHRGLPASLGAGFAASGLAWAIDYHLLPRRLTPGIEARISPRSLLVVHGVFGLALGLAAWLLGRPNAE